MPADAASNSLVLAGVVLAAVALVAWVVTAHRKQARARRELLERVGFRPCPEEKATLEATVARVMNDRDHDYAVEEPRRLAGEKAVYHYVKVRDGTTRAERDAGDELLCRLARPAKAPVVLFVKASAIGPGLATRLLETVATAPWSTQPDDLKRLELPAELKGTNLLGALGPPGARLYDLVDARLLSVVQSLGDAGAMLIRLRDEWCVVEAGHHQVPFRVDELVSRLRPLL